MSRKLRIWETALRDAHQSLWATRMTSDMMEPIIPSSEIAVAVEPLSARLSLALLEECNSDASNDRAAHVTLCPNTA